jgi:hypothetical protein
MGPSSSVVPERRIRALPGAESLPQDKTRVLVAVVPVLSGKTK